MMWLLSHCPAVDYYHLFQLEYTEAFMEYKVLFEQHMESFIVGKP